MARKRQPRYGYTGFIHGSLNDRKPKSFNIDDDAVRGIGTVITPRPTRNLRDVIPPTGKPLTADDVTVTLANGTVRRTNPKMTKYTDIDETPNKPNRRYAGAVYGESWNSKADDGQGDATQREYWFRGVRYESQAAIEAFIATLKK